MGEEISLNKSEVERYSRHFLVPEIGREGQERLKEASVLLVGAGGLGAPAGMYLTAAGIGRLGLVDFDRVELSNLQRQLLHGTEDVGREKLQSARETLHDLNPNVDIDLYDTRLTGENALDILSDYDVVVDGTDNFPTRYLVNDVCVFLGKPNVYGSVFQLEGQASVFYAERGPCYRCLYEEPPPPDSIPNCAEGGVLGVLPGIIGSIQAQEAIKLILDRGEPLIGRFLQYDAMQMEFHEFKLEKNEGCPVCGKNPEVTEPIDYEEFCGVEREEQEREGHGDWREDAMEYPYPEIGVEELRARLEEEGEDPYLLDVRTAREVEICCIEGAMTVPFGSLERFVDQLPEEKEIVVYCRSGQRSAEAQKMLLEEYDFEDVKNLRGGILAWARKIDESMPVY